MTPNYAKILKTTLIYVFLVTFALILMFPFYWMLSGSLKSYADMIANPVVWFPTELNFSNYSEAIAIAPFDMFFKNTVFVSFMNSIITLFTTILAAYAFAVMDFKGKNVIFTLMLATLMIPGQLLFLTNYKTVTVDLGLANNLWALVVPYTASAFYIYLLRQFFMAVPREYYDAAKVDGCTDWRYLWNIMVPNCKNALVTIFLFNWIASWNAYLWPLMVTNQEEKRVLSVALKYFTNDAGSDYHLMMVAGTIVVMPLLLIYIVARKYILEGVAGGGVKG